MRRTIRTAKPRKLLDLDNIKLSPVATNVIEELKAVNIRLV
ncbi:MAG: hypothetical protein ACE5H4_13310 [Candidatus Thorarchaeota archaeon]